MALNREQRDKLVDRWQELNKRYWSETGTLEEQRRWINEQKDLKAEFCRNVPYVPISRCPYCGTLLSRKFDLYGFYSPFWEHCQDSLHPDNCKHCIEYEGAMHLHGQNPSEEAGRGYELATGPEIPYIRRDVMKKHKCVVVFSQLTICNDRYSVYFMCYYSDAPTQKNEGYWPRSYRPEKGITWIDEEWDYDIRQWLKRAPQRLLWIAPGDKDFKIEKDWSDSPYLDIKGRWKAVYIGTRDKGKIVELDPPDGSQRGLF